MADNTPYSIDLPTDLRKKLERDAKTNGRTLADHIRFVLRLKFTTESK